MKATPLRLATAVLTALCLLALLGACELVSPQNDAGGDEIQDPVASFDNLYLDSSYTYATWADIAEGSQPDFALGDYNGTVNMEGTTQGSLRATVGAAAAGAGWSAGTLAQVTDEALANGSYFDLSSVSTIQFKLRGTLPLASIKVKMEEIGGAVPVNEVGVASYGVTEVDETAWAQATVPVSSFVAGKQFKAAFIFVLGTTPGYVEFKDLAFLDANDQSINIALHVSYADTGASVDRSALVSAIATATTLGQSTGVGTAVGQVTTVASGNYFVAIAAAQAVLDNPKATQNQIDSAVATLAAATATFEASKVGEGSGGTPVVTPPTLTDPTVSAADPTSANLSAAFVVYSDAKAATATVLTYSENWWGGIVQSELAIGGNKALRYLGTGAAGECQAIVAAPVMNVTGKTRFHMDLYSSGVGLLKIKFVSNDGNNPDNRPASMMQFDVSAKQNSWESIDVSVASIVLAGGAPAAVNWSSLEKIGLILDAPMTGGATSRIYVDNIYFY